mgnify:CR=1 FL=1
MATVYLGLGSNIDPERNLHACAELLRKEFPGITFSSVYETAPRDVEDQAHFLNAMAKIETELSPEELFEKTQAIEQKLDKDPPYEKGPRTIDIDFLLYDDAILPSSEDWETYKLQTTNYKLVIPHPLMHDRRFVLAPLLELINGEEKHPVLGLSWRNLLKKNFDQACRQNGLNL